ncbi:MAG TPA: hypothetical protein PKL83_05820, partial [bacterium]|nr:hypothetical protein [bacterium]
MSEQLRRELNEDIERILRFCLQETEKQLRKRWDLVEMIVGQLMEYDELELLQIKAIIDQYENAGKTKNGPLTFSKA